MRLAISCARLSKSWARVGKSWERHKIFHLHVHLDTLYLILLNSSFSYISCSSHSSSFFIFFRKFFFFFFWCLYSHDFFVCFYHFCFNFCSYITWLLNFLPLPVLPCTILCISIFLHLSVWSFKDSFIHYRDLYSTSARSRVLWLRSALDPACLKRIV